MREALKTHWKEYLCEAAGLGLFMISACGFGVLFFYPGSPLVGLDGSLRNFLMGLAMGLTALGVFLSPWGKRSGAHINPSVTLTFFRLGKVNAPDALFYILAQFTGGILGVLLSSLSLGKTLSDSAVNFVVTVPGNAGVGAAFLAEFIISFLMMTMVLVTGNSIKLSRLTPFFAAFLVMVYITFENPLSGMSMNPARTFGSALVAGVWTGWWIYFVAPPLGMLAAAEIYIRIKGLKAVLCAKFSHPGESVPCIFNCDYGRLENRPEFIEVTRNQHLFTTVSNGLF